MKLGLIPALALIAAPALAQSPAPRDPVLESMSSFGRTCSGPAPSTRDPASYEANAKTCETALAGLDAYFSSLANPTTRQRAHYTRQQFSIQRNIASAYKLADMQADIAAGRRLDRTPSNRACRAFEAAFETHNNIDWASLGSALRPDVSLRVLVSDLQSCRDRHGAPAGAAPLPVLLPLPRPAPPPLGTLAGDGSAFVGPCMTILVDDAVPLPRRIETCERVATYIPLIRAQYPDAPDGEVFSFEVQAANMLVSLALLQLQADGGDHARACATLEAAELATARLRALPAYATMVGPIVNFVNRTAETCRQQ